MTLVYSYKAGRFLRNNDDSLLIVDFTKHVSKKLQVNTRWVNLNDLGNIDLAYIRMENELAHIENKEKIKI